MLKHKQFKYGFASLNKQNAKFVDDFLSLFDQDTHIYFSVSSKMEYIILQLFKDYDNNPIVDADLMKYSIVKALNMYHPDGIIKCIYESPKDFIEELKKFFQDRIECNKGNQKLNIEFSDGFTVLTGKTGAGKSVIMGALKLLFGERADKSLIRIGENNCEIAAEFSFNALFSSSSNCCFSIISFN